MKKILSIIIGLLSLSAVYAKTAPKVKVVTTIFPEYDWTKQIAGADSNRVELTLLLDNGVDLHSYQPTAQDMAKISNADVFIYVGGESDGWVENVLKSAKNKNLTAINLLQVLGNRVKEEEVIEGMQVSEHHHHDDDDEDEDEHHHHEGEEQHHHDDDDEDEEETEYDEHVWLSLRSAKILCEEICRVLSEKDAENAAAYKANCESYTKKLDELDAQYTKASDNAKIKTILFGDRFPFRYLTDDYGLKYYAAFVGCSAETEASFKTIAFLSKKVDELNLNYVFQIESSTGKISKTIIKNSKNKKAKVLTLDSMQSTTSRDIKKGAEYLKIMQKNLEVLKTAFENK
ncbi:MAG: zinc ABC transporter substrate-binding protein [Treponema sp.]|nr:zinc ABC transporter substrate-binding protein [Treponema sp.]